MKRKLVAQWTNLLRNNGFVNPTPFPMLCEKSGALHLAEPGLTAEGRQEAGGRRQTKMLVNSNFLKLAVDCIIQLFASFKQGTASL